VWPGGGPAAAPGGPAPQSASGTSSPALPCEGHDGCGRGQRRPSRLGDHQALKQAASRPGRGAGGWRPGGLRRGVCLCMCVWGRGALLVPVAARLCRFHSLQAVSGERRTRPATPLHCGPLPERRGTFPALLTMATAFASSTKLASATRGAAQVNITLGLPPRAQRPPVVHRQHGVDLRSTSQAPLRPATARVSRAVVASARHGAFTNSAALSTRTQQLARSAAKTAFKRNAVVANAKVRRTSPARGSPVTPHRLIPRPAQRRGRPLPGPGRPRQLNALRYIGRHWRDPAALLLGSG
jgi:hypothetical protein